MAGRFYIGTSGFAYPDWAPRFYPGGTRAPALLPYYAQRLPAVELNNTFYRQPRPEVVRSWLAVTPPEFRFCVKAQRGGSMRALSGTSTEALGWLLPPYRTFGERLGAVLFRVPDPIRRDDAALDRLLHAWPEDLPLVMEFQHPSWTDDWVHGRLREAGVALCITELGTDPEPPTVRLTGPFLYLRLRRDDYTTDELTAWAARLEPFLSAGQDVFCFFKHDATGRATELARDLLARLTLDGRTTAVSDPPQPTI